MKKPEENYTSKEHKITISSATPENESKKLWS
jgi:hypothetical protein